MTWTWTAQSIKRLISQEGVIGRVAALYVAAGYSVDLNVETPSGTVSFIAKKKGEKLAIDVYCNIKDVTEENMKKLTEKAKQVDAKPVLVIYGSIRVPREVFDLAKKLGIKLKRVRPYKRIKPH